MNSYFKAALFMTAASLSSLFAAPITGQLSIAGNVTLTPTSATFVCDTGTASCAPGYGNFVVTGPSAQSGSFLPLANTTGTIQSWNNLAGQPLNTAFTTDTMLNFTVGSDIRLSVTFMPTGTGGSCPPGTGMVCTPTNAALVSGTNPLGQTAYNYSDTAFGSTVSFSVAGTATRVSTNEVTPLTGTFSLAFTSTPGTTNASSAALLNQNAVTASYVAVFQTVPGSPDTGVPEPASFALMGAGLIGAGLLRRFRANRS